MAGRATAGRGAPPAAVALVLLAALAASAPAQPGGEAELRRAFAAFIKTPDLRLDVVPDLYPGGFARISLYARRADLGGMVVDEAWFRLVGASLDPEALARGELRVLGTRDSAMHVRASIKSLEAYFQQGEGGIKDLRLWSDGAFLFGRGTVPLHGIPVRVYLKGSFAVTGTRDVYFRIDDLRLNGLPLFSPLVRRWESQINPVFTQSLWPITFAIRGLTMTPEWFIVSSQPDATAPCRFCWGGAAAGDR